MQLRKNSFTLLLTLLATTAFIPYFVLGFVYLSPVSAQSQTDRKAEADRLSEQSIQQYKTSQFQAALQSRQQALQIYQEIGDRFGEAISLGGIGTTYWYLGQFQRAIEFCDRSLVVARKISDRQSETYALGCLGWAYASLEQYPQAIKVYQQQLTIAQNIKDRGTQAHALRGLGQVYDALEEHQKALESYQQSLTITRTLGDRQEEAKLLGNIGSIYSSLKRYQLAIDFSRQSLTILRVIGDRHTEAITLNRIGKLLAAQNQPELAIIFYKQSIKVTEDIRQDLRKLSPTQQEEFVQSMVAIYRNLAVLLRQQNRDSEAQQILDLLKVEPSVTNQQSLPELPQERQIWAGYEAVLGKAIELDQELTQLENIQPASMRTPKQRQRIIELRKMEADITQQFLEFFKSPKVAALVKELKQLPDSFRFTL